MTETDLKGVLLAPARNSGERALRLMQMREETLRSIRRMQATGQLPAQIRKVRRLNLDSAIRRSLVGAKGLRP